MFPQVLIAAASASESTPSPDANKAEQLLRDERRALQSRRRDERLFEREIGRKAKEQATARA